MTPFFSLIIPLYNSGNTLDNALHSIRAQSFQNYELVFVDGGSIDHTLAILSAFRRANSSVHIQLISEPDNSIYDAMNKGLHMASGQWFYFMGGDDTLHSPDVLRQISDAIGQGPADLIYGNVTGADSQVRYADDHISKVLSRGIHHQGIFYRRELFTYTGNYNPYFAVAADYHLTLKIFCNESYKTRYIDLDIAYFGETGLSSSTFDYRFFSYHYRFLARHQALDKIEDRLTCLQKSIFCCLCLVKDKQSMFFAWRNILYYLTDTGVLSIGFKVKTFFRMIYWCLRPTA